MPGKHAPSSPVSFYLSLGRAAGGTLGAIAIVVVLALVAFGKGGGSDGKRDAGPVISTGSPAPSVTASPTPTPSPSPSVRPRSQVRVAVYNGTFRSGLAGKISRETLALGWKVVDVGNNGVIIPVSTIYYKPGFITEAQQLQKQFPGFTKIEPALPRYKADVTMVAGKDYPK